MAIRNAQAIWTGNLKDGNGKMTAGSGVFEVAYSFSTRFEDEPGSNPEELIGAALAGCFSMFLSAQLTENGHPPERVETKARVHLGSDDLGPAITKIELSNETTAPGVDEKTFNELAEISKQRCPISKALQGVGEISLNAKLVG